MRVTVILKIVLLFSLTVTGREITTSDSIISIKCESPKYQIVIKNIESTTSLAQKLLLQCNARWECNVPNANKERVLLEYWCRIYLTALEIKGSSSSALITTTKTLSLMSQGYSRGQDTTAENIYCELQSEDQSELIQTEMQIFVYELAPFANSEEFCLTTGKSKVCSGLKKMLHSSIGRNGLKFSLAMSSSAKFLPQVRFWLDIEVSENNSYPKRLECTSRPVASFTTARINPEYTGHLGEAITQANAAKLSGLTKGSVISIVLGILLILTMVVIAAGSCYLYRQRRLLQIIPKNINFINNSNYDYITTYSAEGMHRVEMAPPVPTREPAMGMKVKDKKEAFEGARKIEAQVSGVYLPEMTQKDKEETVSHDMLKDALEKVEGAAASIVVPNDDLQEDECAASMAIVVETTQDVKVTRHPPRVIVDAANYSHVPKELQVRADLPQKSNLDEETASNIRQLCIGMTSVQMVKTDDPSRSNVKNEEFDKKSTLGIPQEHLDLNYLQLLPDEPTPNEESKETGGDYEGFCAGEETEQENKYTSLPVDLTKVDAANVEEIDGVNPVENQPMNRDKNPEDEKKGDSHDNSMYHVSVMEDSQKHELLPPTKENEEERGKSTDVE